MLLENPTPSIPCEKGAVYTEAVSVVTASLSIRLMCLLFQFTAPIEPVTETTGSPDSMLAVRIDFSTKNYVLNAIFLFPISPNLPVMDLRMIQLSVRYSESSNVYLPRSAKLYFQPMLCCFYFLSMRSQALRDI